MRERSKTYATIVYGAAAICVCPIAVTAQAISAGDATTCAAVLANDSTTGTRIGPGLSDSTGRAADTTMRPRSDSASFGIGGAKTGPADVMLLVGVHADQVTFRSQPHVRVRLCWGGDTLRVVQRDNLPSPIVPGTTYRNVYIAVELIGRINAECLANAIGTGNAQPQGAQRNPPTAPGASAGSCAFLGGAATSGVPNPRPPSR